MKRKVCFMLSLLMGWCFAHAEITIIPTEEGEKVSVDIADIDSITFAERQMVVWAKGQEPAYYPLDVIKIVTMKEDDTRLDISDIQGVATKGNWMFINATTAGQAHVYDMSGRLVGSTTVNKGTTPINMQSLPAGVYVLKTQSSSFKFQKK